MASRKLYERREILIGNSFVSVYDSAYYVIKKSLTIRQGNFRELLSLPTRLREAPAKQAGTQALSVARI